MKSHSLPLLALCIALAGCTSANKSHQAQPSPTVAPQPPKQSVSVEPSRPPFVWLECPPATPAQVIAAYEVTGEINSEVRASLVKAWMEIGGQAVMVDKDQNLSRVDVTPSRISPNLSLGHDSLRTRTRFLVIRFSDTKVFRYGFWDDRSQTFLSGTEASLYRFEPGKAYETFGRYVQSPFAPTKPLINVAGIPDGAIVVCPYTQRPFCLW